MWFKWCAYTIISMFSGMKNESTFYLTGRQWKVSPVHSMNFVFFCVCFFLLCFFLIFFFFTRCLNCMPFYLFDFKSYLWSSGTVYNQKVCVLLFDFTLSRKIRTIYVRFVYLLSQYMAKTKALTSLFAPTVMPNRYSPSMRSSAYMNTWTQILSNGELFFPLLLLCVWFFFYFGTWFIDFLVNVFQDDFYDTSKRWATVISSNNKSWHTSSMYINVRVYSTLTMYSITE